jgi:hypothetical protein
MVVCDDLFVLQTQGNEEDPPNPIFTWLLLIQVLTQMSSPQREFSWTQYLPFLPYYHSIQF